MEKERDKMDNGSYFFRLNQELSGQPEINPYYAISDESVGIGEDYNTLQNTDLSGADEDGPVME